MKFVKVFFIAYFIIAMTQTVFANDSSFCKFRNKIQLDSNQYTIIYFHIDGSCSSCIDNTLSQLYCIKELGIQNLKITCWVHGDREKEILTFKKIHNSLGSIFLNSNDLSEKLGLKNNTAIALFGYDGKLLLELSLTESSKLNFCKTVSEIFTKLKRE